MPCNTNTTCIKCGLKLNTYMSKMCIDLYIYITLSVQKTVLTLITPYYKYSYYHWFLYISCGDDMENLFDNHELFKLVVISINLRTYTFNIRVILHGEVRSQSLLGVKGKGMGGSTFWDCQIRASHRKRFGKHFTAFGLSLKYFKITEQ